MSIERVTYFDFLFNGGKGIRADQIANVDVPELQVRLDALASGQPGYTWYAGISLDQDFNTVDFLGGSPSDFFQLEFPAVEDYSHFGGILIPYEAPESAVTRSRSTTNVLGGDFRQILEPFFLDGDPYRLYISALLLRASLYSGELLDLNPTPRASAFDRYFILTELALPPAFDDNWTETKSVLFNLGDFEGSDKYLHYALPADQGLTPTLAQRAVSGAPDFANLFRHSRRDRNSLFVLYNMYSTTQKLTAADYSEEQVIILPERREMTYLPSVVPLPNANLGFTVFYGMSRAYSQNMLQMPVPGGTLPADDAYFLAGDQPDYSTYPIPRRRGWWLWRCL